jgi:hypothetical protein
MSRMLQRPIYGGVFGGGQYALASMPCVSRGLHTTRYMVLEPRAGMVLSVAEDKIEALADARRVLTAANDLQMVEHIESQRVQGELWPVETGPTAIEDAPRYVSRRRRGIFERSQGKCHYCAAPLDLHGRWHVEHQFPRALGGGDEGLNLVAACVRCNLAKSDRTALEFLADQDGAAWQ